MFPDPLSISELNLHPIKFIASMSDLYVYYPGWFYSIRIQEIFSPQISKFPVVI
jgi:hypothetical protein